jgi:hypothetical protein
MYFMGFEAANVTLDHVEEGPQLSANCDTFLGPYTVLEVMVQDFFEATNSGRVDEKKKGVVRPRVPSSSMTVWTRRSTSSRPRTTW